MSNTKLRPLREVVDQITKSWDSDYYNDLDISDGVASDRRALVSALLAECPGCHGSGRLPYPMSGGPPTGYVGPFCLGCSWVRAFAVREGLAPREGGAR